MTIFQYIGTFSWLVTALFILGIVLLVIEMLQPGIGVPGALGIIALIAAVIIQAKTVGEALILLAVVLVIIGILFLIFARSIYKGRLSKSPVMLADAGEGIDITKKYPDIHVGDVGETVTMLRPVGTASFDGHKAEVVSQAEFVEKGVKVEVVSVEGIRIVVKVLGE